MVIKTYLIFKDQFINYKLIIRGEVIKMAKWNVDPAHTNVSFSVKHMMVSKVRGNFGVFSGEFDGEIENLEGGDINFEIDTASIDTNNDQRDGHLRSPDFFDAEKNPVISFTSKEIKKTDDDEYDVLGDLQIRGTTKPVTFKIEHTGVGKNPGGVTVAGIEGSTKISREAFGLTWNQALETGGVLVGDQIKIDVELQMNPAED